MKFLFLCCSDSNIDPVAPHIFQQAKDYYKVSPTDLKVGNRTVFHQQLGEHHLFLAETARFPSEIYPEISHELNDQFAQVDMIGLVNWHAGANAPEKIFCMHSTADVPSATFGATSGKLLAATLRAIESERVIQGLTDFRTLFEASHWSGLVYGRQPSELLQIKAPVFDIEIGSFPDDWSNLQAQQVLVKALGRITEFCETNRPRALYIGGIHFEPSATDAVFQNVVIEHQLPNHWITGYDLLGAETKIVAAAKSCLEAPELIIFNAGLKSAYKESVRKAAMILGIPSISHKQLRATTDIFAAINS